MYNDNVTLVTPEARFLWLQYEAEYIAQRNFVEKLRKEYLKARKLGAPVKERKAMLKRYKAEKSTLEFIWKNRCFMKNHAGPSVDPFFVDAANKRAEYETAEKLKAAEEAKAKAEAELKAMYEKYALYDHINKWQREKHYRLVTVGSKEFELDDEQFEKMERVIRHHEMMPVKELIEELSNEIDHIKRAIECDRIEQEYYANKAFKQRVLEESRTVEEQKLVADAAQICKIQDYLKETGSVELPCKSCAYCNTELCKNCAEACEAIVEENMTKAHPRPMEYFDNQLAYDRIRMIYNKKTNEYVEPTAPRWFLKGKSEEEQKQFLWYCVGQCYLFKQTFPGISWEECIRKTKNALVVAKERFIESGASIEDRDDIIEKVFNERIFLEENRPTMRLVEIREIEAEDMPGDKVIRRIVNGRERLYTYKYVYKYEFYKIDKNREDFFDADDDEEFDVIENIMDKNQNKVTRHIEMLEALVRMYRIYDKPFASIYAGIRHTDDSYVGYSFRNSYRMLKTFWENAMKALGENANFLKVYTKEFKTMRMVPALQMYSLLDMLSRKMDEGFTITDYVLGDC